MLRLNFVIYNACYRENISSVAYLTQEVIKRVTNGFKTALVSTGEHMGKLFKELEQIDIG